MLAYVVIVSFEIPHTITLHNFLIVALTIITPVPNEI